MRTLHHFNTVNGNNDTINERKVEDGDKDEKLKGDDRSVFYHRCCCNISICFNNFFSTS